MKLTKPGIFAGMAALALVASGCATSATNNSVADGSAAAGAPGTAEFCNWFPQSELPPNPKPAPTPYGDPSDPASFSKLAADIATTFGGMQNVAQYCSSGQSNQSGPIDPAACDALYTGFQYATTPYSVQEMCNFMYMRADDTMWTELTPKVLNQYGDYLGIQTDGQNTPNLAAGPHVTMNSLGASSAQFGSSTSPFGTFTIANGQFDAASLNTALQPVFASTKATFPQDPPSQLPVVAGNTFTVDCTNVMTKTSGTETVPLTSLPTTTTQFWCLGKSNSTQTNPTVGTAYVQVNVTNPTASQASFYVSLPEPGPTDSLMRKSGASYDASNLVVPIGTPEVSQFQTTKMSLPETCTNGKATGSDQCLHIWVTKTKPNVSCVVWMVLEVDKTASAAVLNKYGIDTSNYTAHISLGNNNQKNNWQACQRANQLNTALGLPKSGNPSAEFVAKSATLN